MKKIACIDSICKFTNKIIGNYLHKKQFQSMTFALFGAIYSTRLSITSIGHAMAAQRGTLPKHAVKQIDRLIGNDKIPWVHLRDAIIRQLIGMRKSIVVSLDWTEYGNNKQSRIAVNLITKHGRATPLIWKTVNDSCLKNHRNEYEQSILHELYNILGADVHVAVLADRGFASINLFDFIHFCLGWDYVIRLRKNTLIVAEDGKQQVYTHDLVPTDGMVRKVANALLTGKYHKVKSVVFVKEKGMKEPWIIATSLAHSARNIINMYSRRFTCEEQFRDEKDDRFGAGSREVEVGTPRRRDRILLLHLLATIFVTLLGAAGEKVGYDRMFKANTVKHRTHSLYRQGKEYVKGIAHHYIDDIYRVLWFTINNMSKTYARFTFV